MKRILVPLDGSVRSDAILAQVRRLMGRRTEVKLLRVQPPGEAGYTPEGGASRDALWHLALLKQQLLERGIRASYALLVGDPAERILSFAEEYRPSLIAMTTHGRTGLERWRRGSVAERVLRASAWPLLLWNPHHRMEKRGEPVLGRIDRILVPIDASHSSTRILPLVREMAGLYLSNVVLLHVLELKLRVDFPNVSMAATTAGATARLEKLRRRLGNLPVRTCVVKGDPATAILEVASREKADLIAMTTHGRSGASRWAYGSVAEQVLRHCPYPLLVLRTGDGVTMI